MSATVPPVSRVHMGNVRIVHSPRASRTSRLAISLAKPSDYQLHKQPDRQRLYAREGGLWWSDQLQRWMVSKPALIAEILRSSAFAGHSYDVSAIMRPLQHRSPSSGAAHRQFPLAFEGERHRTLRKKFSAEIAGQHGFGARRVPAGGHGTRASAAGRRPPVLRNAGPARASDDGRRDAAGGSGHGARRWIANDTTAVRRHDFTEQAPADQHRRRCALQCDRRCHAADEKYFRIAMVALSANTLLGSLGKSLAQVLAQNGKSP